MIAQLCNEVWSPLLGLFWAPAWPTAACQPNSSCWGFHEVMKTFSQAVSLWVKRSCTVNPRVVTIAFQSSEVKCEPQAKKRNCSFLGWIKVFIFYSKERSGEEWNQNSCVPVECHREMLGVLWYCWPIGYWYMQVSAESCISLSSPH